jgi:hypothetical protein
MAVSKLLGFGLCPRLRNLSERKLYLLRGLAAPEGLASVIAYDILLKAIRDGWINCCGSSPRSIRGESARSSHCSGSAVLHRAILWIGRPIISASCYVRFSCAIILAMRSFVAKCIRCLAKVSRFTSSSARFTGQGCAGAPAAPCEMIAISGSLTLLTNLVLAWNTQRMQATVDAWRGKGQQVDDDWLRRMGPAHFAHVNFRGTLRPLTSL